MSKPFLIPCNIIYSLIVIGVYLSYKKATEVVGGKFRPTRIMHVEFFVRLVARLEVLSLANNHIFLASLACSCQRNKEVVGLRGYLVGVSRRKNPSGCSWRVAGSQKKRVTGLNPVSRLMRA